jgi:hypothetical protein
MSKTKEKVAPAPPPTETQIETDKLELSSASLEAQAQEKLSSDTIRILKKIAYYTAKVGLPLNEACTLVDVDYEKFMEQMKLEPLLEKIIKLKELEYKKDMLHVLTQKARGGDEKLAQWLLERKYPQEYGDKKKSSGEGTDDIMFEAIRFIRKHGDNQPLVSLEGGQAVIVKHGTSKGLVERADDILGRAASLPTS